MLTCVDPDRARCAPWVPGVLDIGQAHERTLDDAEYAAVSAGISEEEAGLRAFRALEVERVMAELGLAGAVDALPESVPGAVLVETIEDWSAPAVAALNLMGIGTELPGDDEHGVADVDAERARIHLHPGSVDDPEVSPTEQLDALSGLIREFQRSTIYVNGLRLAPSGTAPDGHWALEAPHPGIIAGFGEFLVDKYVTQAWRLA
jgi:hypothetical protein